MILVFDLDGVLIESFEAVRLAYAAAGADVGVGWGKPWRDWCSPEAHWLKERIIPE